MKSLFIQILPVLLVACSEKAQTEPEDCGSDTDTVVALVSSLGFARRDEEGHTSGFDLDGDVTELGDSRGCGIPDQTSAEGVPGIDSAFSGILPALEATQAVAVNGLIEDSILSGELLILLELSRVDDLHPFRHLLEVSGH